MRNPSTCSTSARIGLALVLLGLACGDDGDGGGLGSLHGDPVPEDDAPQSASASLCDAWAKCDCADFPDTFADKAACESSVNKSIEDQIAAGNAAGLTYDASCLGDLLARYDALECQSLSALLEDLDAFAELYTSCKVFYGDDAPGKPCEEPKDVMGDSCVQDVRCEQKVCVSRTIVAKGAKCTAGDLCADGAYCVPTESVTESTCALLPSIGQTCLGPLDACTFEAYCDQTGKTCKALPAAGSACAPTAGLLQDKCAADSACEDDVCVALPGPGEPCTTDCTSGNTCKDKVCQVEAPLVCAASID